MLAFSSSPANGISRSVRRRGNLCSQHPTAVVANPAPEARAAVLSPTVPKENSFSNTAAVIAEFMNVEMKNHLASYAVKFGTKFEDMGLIDGISVSSINSSGMDMDIVTCDEGYCVCIRDEIPWLNGVVLSDASEIPEAVRALSLACGLPDDQI